MEPTFESTVASLGRVVEIMLEREGLTIQKYRVLVALRSGTPTASEVAAEIRVRPQTLTKIFDGLVERGLAKRQVDSTDRRRSLLSLTTSGRGLIRRAERSIGTAMDEIAEFLTPDERDEAVAGMAVWGEAMRRFSERDRSKKIGLDK